MEKDIHYFALYRLALLAGFPPSRAHIIAYASQYVDDATESEPIQPYPDQRFDTVRTAHYELEAFHWNVQKKIYIPFHFLPRHVRWQDPEQFSYLTQRAEPLRTDLLHRLVDHALSETRPIFRLIRLGIALHTAADTFSHHGFSGRRHKENRVRRIWHLTEQGEWRLKLLESCADILLPCIGHTEALTFPDLPYLKWKYTDGEGREMDRDNPALTLEALKLLYGLLAMARRPRAPWARLETDHPEAYENMARLVQTPGDLEARCRAWAELSGAPPYDKTAWRQQALKGDVQWDHLSPSEFRSRALDLRGKRGFERSRWALFHRGAHWQRSLVLGWIN